MNWVGGSRSRLMLKDDVKRQREFFEKKKLQQRFKSLGLPLPNSSETCTSGSMDLVTLFIVNQIAAKKENKDPPKVSVLSGGSRAGPKQRRNEPLVLPMSPCSPSQLSLVEGQAHESSLTRKRKHVSKLSPVLESAFSDNSASDYAPRAAEALSPFSSSSASSAQGGIFPLQLNQNQGSESQQEPPTFCSPAWSVPRPEHDLPRDMMNPRPCPTNLSHLETPSAAQVLFGSPLDPSDDNVPILDFSLNRREYDEPFEDDVFRGFSGGEFSAQDEASLKSKIHLRSDRLFQPLKPQTVPETLCSELPSCANTSFSRPGNSSAILDEGQYSPRCFTSDSSEDEEESCAQTCSKTSSSTESHPRSQGTLQQLCPFPPLKRRLKIREEVTTALKEPNTDNDQQSGSKSTPDFLRCLAQTRCQCWKKTIETRETGTQTDDADTNNKCESAVQCSLMPAPMFNLFQPRVESSVLPLSTRGQTVHTDDGKREALIRSPGTSGRKSRQENWSRMMLRTKCHEDKVNPQSEAFKSSGDGLLSENKNKQSGERLRKTPADEVKRAKGNTEDAQTLQGIADILLSLKQGNHE